MKDLVHLLEMSDFLLHAHIQAEDFHELGFEYAAEMCKSRQVWCYGAIVWQNVSARISQLNLHQTHNDDDLG